MLQGLEPFPAPTSPAHFGVCKPRPRFPEPRPALTTTPTRTKPGHGHLLRHFQLHPDAHWRVKSRANRRPQTPTTLVPTPPPLLSSLQTQVGMLPPCWPVSLWIY